MEDLEQGSRHWELVYHGLKYWSASLSDFSAPPSMEKHQTYMQENFVLTIWLFEQTFVMIHFLLLFNIGDWLKLINRVAIKLIPPKQNSPLPSSFDHPLNSGAEKPREEKLFLSRRNSTSWPRLPGYDLCEAAILQFIFFYHISFLAVNFLKVNWLPTFDFDTLSLYRNSKS